MWARPYFDKPIEGPVKLEILAHYKTSNKKLIGNWKETAPDVDNGVLKSWMDLLQGVAYKNDSQVCSECCHKKWWHCDETHIWVSKL
jgi:Holliday junction resolvase RusA-like endonuclease